LYFECPRAYKHNLTQFGIPGDNILEWEQTERGVEESSQVTRSAFTNYYGARRTKGISSTQAFFTNMSGVAPKTVREEMKNITSEVTFWPVKSPMVIRTFVEKKLGHGMELGTAFYQLTKTEREVQDYKLIAVRTKRTQAVYIGHEARELLSLPTSGTIKLVPGNHGDFDIFIQSTSNNRKLVPKTEVLFWPRAKAYSAGA
jgi:hypothetical protein